MDHHAARAAAAHAQRQAALALLAARPAGLPEAEVGARGFSVELMTALVRDGLATGDRDHQNLWTWQLTAAGQQELAQIASDAGRRARLAEANAIDEKERATARMW